MPLTEENEPLSFFGGRDEIDLAVEDTPGNIQLFDIEKWRVVLLPGFTYKQSRSRADAWAAFRDTPPREQRVLS